MVDLWNYNVTRGLKPFSAVPTRYAQGVKDGIRQAVINGTYTEQQYEDFVGEPFNNEN